MTDLGPQISDNGNTENVEILIIASRLLLYQEQRILFCFALGRLVIFVLLSTSQGGRFAWVPTNKLARELADKPR